MATNDEGAVWFAGRRFPVENSEVPICDTIYPVKWLGLSGLDIQDIDYINGFDNIINVERLSLKQNRFKEIKGLDRFANLKMLELDDNLITCIEGLDKLVNLQYLSLNGNGIERIEGLDKLVRLKYL
nr:leucine-rich repeat domain-containing protein [Candidatus Sigynarchaeota archaeon]